MEAEKLQDNFQYYLDHKEALYKEHPGKFLVIKDKNVIGVYDDQVTAYTETTKDHEPGTFIIQFNSPESTDEQVFHTRVVSVR